MPIESNDITVVWTSPGGQWDEGVPLGNGLMGAVVWGGPSRTVYQLNDAFGWSGSPVIQSQELDRLSAVGAGPDRLKAVRSALDAGELGLAEELMQTFEGRYSQEFLPFADLVLELPGQVIYTARELNLVDATLRETFSVDGVAVVRTSWMSHPDRVLCVHVSSEQPVAAIIKATPSLGRGSVRHEDDSLTVSLRMPADGAPLHEEAEPSHRWLEDSGGEDALGALAATVRSNGVQSGGPFISVVNATDILITVSSATEAENAWLGGEKSGEPVGETERVARERTTKAAKKGPDILLARHISDIRPILSTARLWIGPARSSRFIVGRDILHPSASSSTRATIVTAFGRYLLASCSRVGGPPANLQGIWNADPRPAWSSNYTININTQMNYWLAQPGNLLPVFEPLIGLVSKLSVTGTEVAGRLYGARGWVAHHNTDIWGWALPAGMGHGDVNWAIWPMGGVWLCQNLWDHWDFTKDTNYLREVWPALRGAAEFLLSWLVDGDSNSLRTIPSTSPENVFLGPDGVARALSETVEMDRALTRAHLQRCVEALTVLEIDDPISDLISAALSRLPSPRITAHGTMQEWHLDFEEIESGHRHLSPAVGLYPLNEFLAERDVAAAAAIEKFLDGRGPGAMGWSWAWKIALRARLRDAATAHALFDEATEPYLDENAVSRQIGGYEYGGLLPNLFSSGPPFQIDGNLGLASSVIEMLLQSQANIIDIFPAIPGEWGEGNFSGLLARGGFSVDASWDSTEVSIRVTNLHDKPTTSTLRVRNETVSLEFGPRETLAIVNRNGSLQIV